MPRVRILAAPRPGATGVFALGTGPRTGPVDPATGVSTVIPGKSGRFFANGEQEELVITDEQLKDLQSEPNKSLLATVVIDAAEQPQPEGGDVAANQPGSTVPPGTTPQPAPAPTPTPTAPAPAPGTSPPATPATPPATETPATRTAKK